MSGSKHPEGELKNVEIEMLCVLARKSKRPVCVMRVNDKFFQALKCESLVVVDFFMISAVTAIRTS